MGQQRGRVGCQKMLTLADTEHQRRTIARSHDLLSARLCRNGRESVHPLELLDGFGRGGSQVVVEKGAD
jgi:hypothetical protein